MSTLNEIANRGRNLEAARAEAQAEANRQAEIATAASRREAIQLALGRSLSHFGWLGAMSDWWLFFTLATAALGTVVALYNVLGVERPAFWIALAGAVLVLGGPFLGKRYVLHCLRREIAWLDALPFEVVGYPDLLGWRSYPSVSMAIHCQHEADPELLRVALAEAGLPMTLEKSEDRRVELEVTYPGGSKFSGQRRWFRRWLHRVEPALRALHAEIGLTAIYFYPSTTEALDYVPDIPR